MNLIGDLLIAATAHLRAAGVESPRREARLLLAHTLGVRTEDIVAGHVVPPPPASLNRFEAVIARRAAREPLAYILGAREFWSLSFVVAPGVLVPRPETEVLVEEALKRFPERDAPLRVLDLGTGTGCLLLAFLSERRFAEGIGIDKSDAALQIAAANAFNLGFGTRACFIESDWFSGVSGSFDLIFANPPYIPSGEIAALDAEVACYEPRMALDGGEEGLDAYSAIVSRLAEHLRPGGLALFEVGQGQAEAVAALLVKNGLDVQGTVSDLAGIVRCLVVGAGRERFRKKALAFAARSG